nr:uncharacterized protein LOC110365253 isoform X29 [Columba livia]XP_021155152.1 uncharacterized protein LOC110365253 isoform X29 [Columba livia]
MGLSLQRLAQLCAMSESTETRVISNVNCRLLNYFKPSYDSKSSMILKEMGRVFTNWFCPPPAYEEELSDTRAEVQHALSSPDAGGRSRLLVSNRRLLQHSGTSRSGHCWAPEEFGTGHAPPAGSSQHPAALSSSELPCSRRSRAPGPELQDGIAQSNETRSVPCHRSPSEGCSSTGTPGSSASSSALASGAAEREGSSASSSSCSAQDPTPGCIPAPSPAVPRAVLCAMMMT